jgi:hypothetical protein
MGTNTKIENASLKEKILSSGLVDRHTAEMLERWGYLQPNDAERVDEDALKDATQNQLYKLAEDIAEVIDRDKVIRETNLDLKRLKWPTVVSIFNSSLKMEVTIAENIDALIDSLGRLYFRIQDIDPDWFVPGYIIERQTSRGPVRETVTEASTLYTGEDPIAFQVSVSPC